MKCQHCGSTDIIEIQGQQFCLNCGFEVKSTSEKPEVAAPKVEAADSVIPKAEQVEVKPEAAPVAAEPEEPVPLAAIDPLKLTKTETKPVKKMIKAKPADKTKAPTKSAVKSDDPTLRPDYAAVASAAPLPVKKPTRAEAKKAVEQESSKKEEPKKPHHSHHSLDLRVRHSQVKHKTGLHPFRFALGVGLGVGAVLGGVTAAALYFRLDGDTTLYLIVVALLAAVGFVALSVSALLYGASRREDGRPAPHSAWWAVARNGFMDVVNVGMISLIFALILFGIAAGSWVAIIQTWNLDVAVAAPILTIINLAVVWALAGTYVARRLAIPAVVIGGLTAWDGFTVGWKLYLQAGGHLVVALLETLMWRVLAILGLAIAVYAALRQYPELLTNSGAATVVASSVLVGLVATVFIVVLLEIESRLWLHQYRHWVTLLDPAMRLRLLTGRVTTTKS